MIELTLFLSGTFFLIHSGIIVLFTVFIHGWKSASNTTKPCISIIVAARNEHQNLTRLIPRITSQDYPDFEVIIGLDRCTDESLDFLQSLKDDRVKTCVIDSIPKEWNPKKYVLNESIKLAKNDWLVLTDADCIPDSSLWLESLSREMNDDTQVVLGISPYFKNRSFLSRYIQFEAFMTFFLYSAFTQLRKPYMAVGRNMAIKRSLFVSQEGYQGFEGVQGGDDDLFIQKVRNQAGIRMAIGKDSLVHTFPSRSWKSYSQQKKRHFSVSKRYSADNQIVLSLFHLTHIFCYSFMFSLAGQVYFLPIILFYLFIKLVSYRFVEQKIGAGFNYILFPFVDITYAFLTPILGIWSKLVKDIEWKN